MFQLDEIEKSLRNASDLLIQIIKENKANDWRIPKIESALSKTQSAIRDIAVASASPF